MTTDLLLVKGLFAPGSAGKMWRRCSALERRRTDREPRFIWEFDEQFKAQLYAERALGIDMETATLFSVGFASKVPIGALLLVSDLPLKKDGIKTKQLAHAVFKQFTDLHIDIGVKAMSEIAERGEHIRHYRW